VFEDKEINISLRADLGGAYIGVTQDRVMALLKRFNLTLYDVYREGQSVALNGPNSTPKHYSGLIPPYSFPALVDLNTLLVSMDQLVQTIDVENPWFDEYFFVFLSCLIVDLQGYLRMLAFWTNRLLGGGSTARDGQARPRRRFLERCTA
jgi:hypothetical protein